MSLVGVCSKNSCNKTVLEPGYYERNRIGARRGPGPFYTRSVRTHLNLIFTPPDIDHVPRPDRVYPAPPPSVPVPSAPVAPGPSSGPAEPITGISNLVISTLGYTSDGSVGSVDGVPSSTTVEERITKKGKKYKMHTWKGKLCYSLPTLRAAYAARKVEQAELFSTLAAFGYLQI